MLLLGTALLVVQASAPPAAPAPPLVISLAHNSPAEQRTRDQLTRLLQSYDLQAWTFTDSVVIDQEQIPHSHPVLTLHTRHLNDDDLLLSTYVHEQLHWYVVAHRAAADSALHDLRPLLPELPVGFPAGSDSKEGNDSHILVITLEYQALRGLLGELRARQVMEFWATDHYTAVYTAVLANWRRTEGILRRRGLSVLPARR